VQKLLAEASIPKALQELETKIVQVCGLNKIPHVGHHTTFITVKM
jgi:hypothetical protein